jgi:hypothetical protein
MKPERKILIVANYKLTKKQAKAIVKETTDIMMAGDAFSKVTIDIDYKKFGNPENYEDAEGKRRITHDWFETHISTYAKAMGYNSSRFLFSLADGRFWGLDSGIRGHNYSDDPNDFHGEGWIKANATTRVRFEDGSSRLAIPKIIAHEEGHELKHAGLTRLEIHNFDYQDKVNNVEGFYKQLVLLDNQPAPVDNYTSMMTWLNKLKEELLNRATYPIPRSMFQKNVTQHWLVANPIYASNYHNGVDIVVPNGQVIAAPQKGRVYLSGLSKQLGNFCFYECVIDGQKTYHLFPHLSSQPRERDYARGEEIGRVGNTGLSTNPHMHWTILTVKPVSVSHYVSLVDTKEKIIKNTIDPYTFALYAVDRIKL